MAGPVRRRDPGRNRLDRDPAHLHLEPAGSAQPGSTGQIVPGYEAKIVDEQGQDLPPGSVGTLWIKGDSTASEYWNKHEQTKDTICGHWINTRDKFQMDDDGYFWYAGRTDDMMKVSGQAVWPADVEGVLMKHPAVLESGVVGALDADGLTRTVAYVVLKDGQAETADLARELQQFVKQQTAPHKYPRAVVFVDPASQDRHRQDQTLPAARARRRRKSAGRTAFTMTAGDEPGANAVSSSRVSRKQRRMVCREN
jgi:acyl-coenzyme A synthetase/AMP-(fatty) acid ligase